MSIFTGLNMWQFDEGKCHICQRVFCCGKCRSKHQFKTHAIAVREPLAVASAVGGIVEHKIEMESGRTTIYVFCPICEQKPLMLCEEIYAELLAHIETAHLPLRCRKCLRNYTKISDLREFSKCVDMRQDCSGSSSDLTANTDASKVTVKQALAQVPMCTSSISTQTSPGMTPISLINMRWKAKSRVTTHEEMISDSVSSIRNISSISNGSIRRSIGQLSSLHETVEKGKVIRSTSTPVQLESMFAKPKEPLTFNASSGGHVSSIYQEEPSPALEGNPIQQQQQQQQQLQQRPWKVGARSKMTAVTPLRHVMSKSIQKAFVEHGAMLVPPPTGLMQRRVRLDLSDNNNYTADGAAAAAGSSALDLRLSPVVRRTQSEGSSSASEAASSLLHPHDVYQRQFMLSAQKLTTESIIITRTMPSSMGESNGSTVYNSCESVEIIRSTSESAEVHLPPITPITRVSGAAINKKQIKFETPHKSLDAASQSGEEESKDAFYTPNPGTPEHRRRPTIVPRQISGEFSPAIKKENSSTMNRVTSPPDRPRARPPLRDCHKVRAFSGVQDLPVGQSLGVEEDEDDVFLPTNASTRKDRKRDQGTGRLWSIMSTMMRLPATLRGDKNDRENKENNGPSGSGSASGSLIRRCASIAGSLVRTSSRDGDDEPPLKRKRTQTLDNNQYCTSMSPSSSSKRYRIRPREPIERMRHK
ncbi:mitosis initiation protein fs(1)Ya [Drosophila subobscura]|uniref:mitosis initiation protein fs(1)Ya n=1 Tax=Drosophila subobscura TaxID=7241 RepID=UPI00155B0C1C|nr:mitosis initiation protein fs(1)Ya [Drosophila subobscura]